MTRCYIRLLPEVPFVLYYYSSGADYWMSQFFDADSSETVTITNAHDVLSSASLLTRVKPLLQPTPSTVVSCRSLFLLSSDVAASSFHSLLNEDTAASFIAVTSSYLAESHNIASGLAPPLSAPCELLLRFSPRVASSLPADRLSLELETLLRRRSGEWLAFDGSLLPPPGDFAEEFYFAALQSSSREEAETRLRSLLHALPTLVAPPSLACDSLPSLCELARRGSVVLSAGDSVNTGDSNNAIDSTNPNDSTNPTNSSKPTNSINSTNSTNSVNPTNPSEQMKLWCKQVDAVTELLTMAWDQGLRSLSRRLLAALRERNIGLANMPLARVDEENEDAWVAALRKAVLLYGYCGLLETYVGKTAKSHLQTTFAAPELQFCEEILARAVASSDTDTMLLRLPPDIAMKLYATLPTPDLMIIQRTCKEGAEKICELNEVEVGTMDFYLLKEVFGESYLRSEEVDGLRRILGNYCDAELLSQAMKNFEERNLYMQKRILMCRKMKEQTDFAHYRVSVRRGNPGF